MRYRSVVAAPRIVLRLCDFLRIVAEGDGIHVYTRMVILVVDGIEGQR